MSNLAPLPGWLKVTRWIIALVAFIYWGQAIWLPISERPEAVNLLWALVVLSVWFSPWFWFRAPWLWWPLYLLSALISVSQVRVVIAACLMQSSTVATPFGAWPWTLKIVFGVAILFALCCACQTVVLGVGRVRGFAPRVLPSRKARRLEPKR